MTKKEIRNELEQFIGTEKYIHFILSLYESAPRRERLLFWQEEILNEFTKSAQVEPIGFDSLYSIFNCCPIHKKTLKQEEVLIVNGNYNNSKIPYGIEKKTMPLANINAPEIRNDMITLRELLFSIVKNVES